MPAAARTVPQEHSKLYCLCKKPYDEDIPMVGCDYCQASLEGMQAPVQLHSQRGTARARVLAAARRRSVHARPSAATQLPRLCRQDWYHHACMGLRAPGTQGDGDDTPETFRCPLCCMRVGGRAAPARLYCLACFFLLLQELPWHTA